MAEALLIAFSGGASGLLIAFFMVQAMSSIEVPGDIPIQLTFALDQRVLWFTLFVSMASALLFRPSTRASGDQIQPDYGSENRSLGSGAATVLRKKYARLRADCRIPGTDGGGDSDVPRIFLSLSHSPGFRTDHLLMMSFDTALAARKSILCPPGASPPAGAASAR
jgi:hypothetical protein